MQFLVLLCALLLSQVGAQTKSSNANAQKNIRAVSLAKDLYLEGLKLEWQERDSLAFLYFEQAAKLDTSSPYLASLVFQRSVERKDPRASLAWAFESHKRSGQSDASAAYYLGSAYKRNNQCDSAISYLEISKSHASRPNLNALQDLSNCYQILERYDSALTNLALLASYANYPQSVINRYTQIAEYSKQSKRILPFFKQAWDDTQEPELGLQYVQWLSQFNQDRDALDVLSQLIQIQPKEANRYHSLRALLFDRVQAYDSAYAETKLRTDSRSADELFDLAKLSLRLNRPKECLVWLKQIAQDSLKLQKFALGAAAYNLLDQKDSAIILLEKAYALAPTQQSLLWELWELKSQQPKFQQKLLLELEQVLKQNPQDLKAHWTKAKTLQEIAQQSPKSTEWLEKASTEYSYLSLLDAQNPKVFLEYADLLVQLNLIKQAQFNLDRAYKLDSNSAATLNALGYFLVDQNIDVQAGKALIEKALKFAPNTPAILDSYAWALFHQGKAQEALDLLLPIAQDMRQKPQGNWEYFYHLALIFQALQQKDDALKWAELAAQSNPKSKKIQELLILLKQP